MNMKKLISLILLSFFTQHSFAQSVTTISWEEKREIDQNVITVKPKDENSRLLKPWMLFVQTFWTIMTFPSSSVAK